MRRYITYVSETVDKRGKLWHVYVTANRRFSLKEVLAKQHWILRHIDQLPFNHIALKTAACRESICVIEPILPAPDTVAFHVDEITLDKVARKVCWAYDFVLEFVFHYKKHVEPFLEFLKKHWKGTWEMRP